MLFPVEIHGNEVVLMSLRDRYVRKRVTLDYLRNVLIPNSSSAQCCVFKMLLPRLSEKPSVVECRAKIVSPFDRVQNLTIVLSNQRQVKLTPSSTSNDEVEIEFNSKQPARKVRLQDIYSVLGINECALPTNILFKPCCGLSDLIGHHKSAYKGFFATYLPSSSKVMDALNEAASFNYFVIFEETTKSPLLIYTTTEELWCIVPVLLRGTSLKSYDFEALSDSYLTKLCDIQSADNGYKRLIDTLEESMFPSLSIASLNDLAAFIDDASSLRLPIELVCQADYWCHCTNHTLRLGTRRIKVDSLLSLREASSELTSTYEFISNSMNPYVDDSTYTITKDYRGNTTIINNVNTEIPVVNESFDNFASVFKDSTEIVEIYDKVTCIQPHTLVNSENLLYLPDLMQAFSLRLIKSKGSKIKFLVTPHEFNFVRSVFRVSCLGPDANNVIVLAVRLQDWKGKPEFNFLLRQFCLRHFNYPMPTDEHMTMLAIILNNNDKITTLQSTTDFCSLVPRVTSSFARSILVVQSKTDGNLQAKVFNTFVMLDIFVNIIEPCLQSECSLKVLSESRQFRFKQEKKLSHISGTTSKITVKTSKSSVKILTFDRALPMLVAQKEWLNDVKSALKESDLDSKVKDLIDKIESLLSTSELKTQPTNSGVYQNCETLKTRDIIKVKADITDSCRKQLYDSYNKTRSSLVGRGLMFHDWLEEGEFK